MYLILFYATFVGTSLEESFEFIRLISRVIGRCSKFAGIAATLPDIVDVLHAPDLDVSRGRSNSATSFRLPRRRRAFEGLDLCMRPGEHVGLVGPSGSGKTTLTKLLLRFAARDGGAIEIDGQDIARVTQHSLRRHIAYVPQDPQMLHRTIAENICYGLGQGQGLVDMDVVKAVGRAAYVDEFVERLPLGYQTVVGERGMKLSGGQRQRVAIAQAMAKGARVLVLDEATSALDSESESLVQEALWNLMEGTTALVVAHRLATIARLDRIVVLDHGRIVEQGTHAELLDFGQDGVYSRLWSHQSGGFLAASAQDPKVDQVAGRPGVLGAAPPSSHPGPGQTELALYAGIEEDANVRSGRKERGTSSTNPACQRCRRTLHGPRPRIWRSPVPARCPARPSPSRTPPVEAFEELVPLTLGYSRALVEHLHPRVGVDAVDDSMPRAAAGSTWYRVRQQIADQLVQPGRVPEDRHLVARFDTQCDPRHGRRRSGIACTASPANWLR